MESEHYGMACMEIWGGNQIADKRVRTPGLDINVVSRPLEGAGGDVHYVSLCGGGLTTRILLADIAGHGNQVADLALQLGKLIRRYINVKDQSRLFARLNEQMASWSTNGLFATSLVATYLADRRELTMSNAGHPRPLLFNAQTSTWRLLTSHSMGDGRAEDLPLGVLGETVYTLREIELSPGDRVVFYTDALMDAHDSDGQPLGEKGVLQAVRRLPLHSGNVASALLDEIISKTGPQSPADDATVLELRHSGDGPEPPSLKQRLKIYGKFFKVLPTRIPVGSAR